MRIKKTIKKAGAVALAVAMVIGMIPAWSSQAVAETAKKPYEAILESDIAYDELYTAIGNQFYVYKNGVYGVIGEEGKEVIPLNCLQILEVNENRYLVQAKDKSWSILDTKGNPIATIQKKYDNINVSKNLYASMDGENDGDILDKNGNLISHYYEDESKLYTGTVEYDELTLLEDGEHFIASNDVVISGNEDEAHLYLIKLNGDVVKDLGICVGQWNNIEGKNLVTYYNQVEDEHGNYDNVGGCINMDGKVITSDGYDVKSFKVTELGIEMHNESEYVRYNASTFEKECTVEFTSDNEEEECTSVLETDAGIYYNMNHSKWYCVDKKTLTKKEASITGSISNLFDIGNGKIVGIDDGDDESYGKRHNSTVYILDSNLNELKKFEYKNVTHLYMGGDDTVGKLFEVGYYTEERNDAPYVDLINAETGEKVLVKYDDIVIQDNTSEKINYYVVAKKNEKLYLINATNGNVISELGEGSYGYGDKYGKFIFVTVFSGDDYQYYVYNNEGKKLVTLEEEEDLYKFDDDSNYLLISNNGKNPSEHRIIDFDGNVLLEGTDYTTDISYKDVENVIMHKVALRNEDENWKLFNGENGTICDVGNYDYLQISENIVSCHNILSIYDETECEVRSSIDGTMILTKDQIDEIELWNMYGDNRCPAKINGKWGIYKFNPWTAEDAKNNPPETTPGVTEPTTPEEPTTPGVTGPTTPAQPTTPGVTKPTTPSTQPTTKPENGTTTVDNSGVKPSAPAKATVGKVKAGKKKATISVKKVKGAKGYLVQYSTNKKFKGAKSKYVTKNRTTIKKLKSKKIYYFRVKAYKMNGKKKVFSKKWSAVKKVKVK